MIPRILSALLLLRTIPSSSAFVAQSSRSSVPTFAAATGTTLTTSRTTVTTTSSYSSTLLKSAEKGSDDSNRSRSGSSSREESILDEASEIDSKAASGVNEAMRTKLLSESIAPWRTVRLFAYGSLGSGALVGGLITLAGAAAALSGAKPDVDMNTEYLNLAIDFGAVLAFVFLFKWDLDRGSELQDMVDTKLESKKKDKVLSVAMKEREITLSNLKISVRVSEEGETREASLGGVQEGAKQHVILVAGGRSAIRDALLGANLMSMDFAMRDVLIVPYEIGLDDATRRTRPSGGFGDAPKWETANYVARCVGDGWKEYIDSEMKDAIAQNGEKVTEDGIAVVVKNDGTIIRRGVGKVPWRDMVDELEGKKDDGVEMADLRFLSPGGQ